MTAPDHAELREALTKPRHCVGQKCGPERAAAASEIGRLLAENASLLTRLAKAEGERDEARAEIARLIDPELKALRLADGSIDMAVAGPLVERMACAMAGYFRQSGADNYVELNLNARDTPFERYCVTVQKVGQRSPHELRQAAEAQRDAALASAETSVAQRDTARADLDALKANVARKDAALKRIAESSPEPEDKNWHAAPDRRLTYRYLDGHGEVCEGSVDPYNADDTERCGYEQGLHAAALIARAAFKPQGDDHGQS